MKINNIQQQNFKGLDFSKISTKAENLIAKHPVAVAGIAGSSVIAQKIVMSSAEAFVSPVIDVKLGKAITAVKKEKDDRTNDASRKQAIRTFSQSVGGTITGVIIRGLCIAAATYGASKLATKAIEAGVNNSNAIEKMFAPVNEAGELLSKTAPEYFYKLKEKTSAWGKSIGGAVAIVVMLFTNFLIDVPIINAINTLVTKIKQKNNTKQPQPNIQKADNKVGGGK